MTNTIETQIKVGWSTVSITPDRPVQLQGQHHERVSTEVHDEIEATAFAIDASGSGPASGSVFISCDLANIPASFVQAFRSELGGKVEGIDPDRVVIVTTHTHTAPVISDGFYPEPPPGVMSPAEYREFLSERLIAVTREAWESRKRTKLAPALGYAAVGFNRRVAWTDGTSKMYGDTSDPSFAGLEGGHDHGVELLYGFDETGRLEGVVVNLACPSQVVESKCYVSGDFWSSVRRRVRRRFGDRVHVLPLCSAAGDQSPRDLVRRGRRDADFREQSGLEEMGRRIFACIEDRYETAEESARPIVEFAHDHEMLDLPGRKITEEEAATITAEKERYEQAAPEPGSPEGGRLRKAERALERYRTQGERPRYGAEVHVLRIGDVVWATNPFELFLDYGLRIKGRSPAVQTFVVQLAGDRALYLPTEKAVASGHYGTIPTESLVGPDGGEVLVEETLRMIGEVYRD